VVAADMHDRTVTRRDVACEHAVLGIDRQDRPAAEDDLTLLRHCSLWPGSSAPENPSGMSCASVHERRSPCGLIATTVTADGSDANSSNSWRHAPHGALGGETPVHTATASSWSAPALIAAATALRSAHTHSGYDAHSTFTPSNV